MEQKEKIAILLTQGKDGEIRQTEITQEELDRIFFKEGNRTWDQIHTVLPEPVWEKIYEDGYLLYEGFTIDHKAFGAGKAFYRDGKPRAEGIFSFKGLLCGREYYPDGKIRFEGTYRLNQAYGPNFPDFGSWYDEDGKRIYRGNFKCSRSSLGLPRVEEPKGFTWERQSILKNHTFIWEDAKKYMKQTVLNGSVPDPSEIAQQILNENATKENRKGKERL